MASSGAGGGEGDEVEERMLCFHLVLFGKIDPINDGLIQTESLVFALVR